MNSLTRTYNRLTEQDIAKIYKNIDIKTEKAKERCEKKYKGGNCIKMNSVAYCYNCKQGLDVYWRTKETCGCKISSAHGSFDALLQHRLNEFVKEKGLSKDKYPKKEADRLKKELKKELNVNDAFFFEVQDSDVSK